MLALTMYHNEWIVIRDATGNIVPPPRRETPAHQPHQRPLRTYHCVNCLNEQKHQPSDFRPGHAPLCHRCQGTLRKGPGPGHNDEAPPTPQAREAAAVSAECPFDVPTSTPGTNPAHSPAGGLIPANPQWPQATPRARNSATSPADEVHPNTSGPSMATPGATMPGERGNHKNAPQVNSKTEKAAVLQHAGNR